jgi:hypothetical protein
LKSSKRPRYVTWLSIGVLTLSGYYLIRLVLGLDQPDIPISIPWWYLPFTGAVWGAAGITAAYGLFRGTSWALTYTRWGAAAFAAWYWIDRITLSRSSYLDLTWPAALIITVVVLSGLYWLLHRPNTRSFFGEVNS